MKLAELRKEVCQANKSLVTHNLVTFTWGNVSAIDSDSGLMVIKPSGVEYDDLTAENMVLVDMEGKVVEGKMRPSSDTDTHLILYQRFPEIKGIVHTHSPFATSWAQAGRGIPALGTTHADYFHGGIPCARALSDEEIQGAYERETGNVIAEAVAGRDPMEIPGILVREHAPFAWGTSADNAVHNAVVIEEVAKMALNTMLLNPGVSQVNQVLLDKHYLRKHGKNAYYGQK